MTHQQVMAAIECMRLDVCCAPSAYAQNTTVSVGRDTHTGAGTSRFAARRRVAGDPAGGSAGHEARVKADTTVTVLSAVNGREDVAQMTRRLAADAVAAARAPGVSEEGRREETAVDEDLLSAQLAGGSLPLCVRACVVRTTTSSSSCLRSAISFSAHALPAIRCVIVQSLV